MNINFIKLDPRAIAPRPSYRGDACFELVVVSAKTELTYAEYDIGLAFQIPRGYVGIVFPIAGLSEECATMPNSMLVIEPDNRNRLKLRFRHPSGQTFNKGDKIAKLLIVPTPDVSFIRQTSLPFSDRDLSDYEPRER